MSLRNVLTTLIAVLAIVLTGCNDGTSSSGGPAAVNGFRNLLGATFTHPRCTECHDFDLGNALAQRHENRSRNCAECHTVPLWRQPVDAFSFSGISTREVCQAIKNKFGGSVSQLRDHFATSTLVNWGVSSGLVPSGQVRPTAPPNSLPALLQLVDQWIANGAVCD